MTSQPALDAQAVELAIRLIRIPSLTPVTPDLRPAARACLTVLSEFLGAAGARCEWLTFSGGHERWGYPVDNLYAEWGDAQSDKRLCFIGHIDVVPPSDLSLWSADPYSGVASGGFIHGRGATDMKGAVAAFTAAAAGFAASRNAAGKPANVSLIVTADEEWAAVNGVRRVLDWMRAGGKRASAFVVGEPSSEEVFGSAIKIGRRGSLCGTLEAAGVQGHAAYPELFRNPNRALSLALAILHTHRWDDGESGMPATNFETIATAGGDFAATAIVPGEAKALWNIRFTHRQTVSKLVSELQHFLDRPPAWAMSHPDIDFLKTITVRANMDTAAMPYFSPPGQLAALAKAAVSARAGREPSLDAKGGTTDGRHVHLYFPQAEIIELGLPECGGLTGDQHPAIFRKQGGMHQADECCANKDLQTLTWCYWDLLQAYAEDGV